MKTYHHHHHHHRPTERHYRLVSIPALYLGGPEFKFIGLYFELLEQLLNKQQANKTIKLLGMCERITLKSSYIKGKI
jgi:hypothetical protein